MNRWSRPRPGVVALVLALVLVLLAGNALALAGFRANLRPAYVKDGLLVVLVIGSDIGWPHRPGDPLTGRADGLHLIAVDTQARRATIVDFPRDSLIGGTKVNGHLAFGGPERLKAQLEAYTGLPIDYWALTSFIGLEGLVEAMGGIDIVVERRMNSPEASADLYPGPQTLSGWQAVAFSRDRKSQPRGDFDRTRHQGQLLRSAHEQIRTRQSDLPTLTRLVAAFVRNTYTDIPRDQLLPLALLATQIAPEDVLQVPLEGGIGTTSAGASIVRLNPGNTFERIRAGQVGPPAGGA